MATKSGFFDSNIGSASYTIAGSPQIGYGSGFTAANLSFNGSAKLNGTRLQVTDVSPTVESGSAWFTTPVNIQKFTTDFTFQITQPNADGMTFAIQNVNTNALGNFGIGLGYGAAENGTPGIPNSTAVKFDLYDNLGEGNNSTGVYTGGGDMTLSSTTLGGGVDLHSGHVLSVHLVYDGTTLTMTITDTTNTTNTFTKNWTVNIPAAVGANIAWVGFTGGTGDLTAKQEILTWTYTVN